MEQGLPEEIIEDLNSVVTLRGEGVTIEDEHKLKGSSIDKLVHNAVFGESSLREVCSYLIWEAGLELEIVSASIHDLYMAAGQGKYSQTTVPAINIRGLTYDVARAVFRSAINNNVGTFIFEIARSEIDYTNQTPLEYATVIIAAAIKEGFSGPVFVQGDHFQVNTAKYASDPDQELLVLKQLIREAIEAGFYNIDIDTSTLVDMNKQAITEQQHLNYALSAELTSYIRNLEPNGITISVGGEIGEVGGKNSTVEELKAYLDNYQASLQRLDSNFAGLSKISIQTGTTHGGVVLPDGSIAQVNVDFDTLRTLSQVAKEQYALGGAVQHGASTLPDNAFHHFPDTNTCEVHLATGFQNIIYEHPALPAAFRDQVYQYLFANFAAEKREGQSETQFIYKTRKKGFGPLKQEWWHLPIESRELICRDLEKKFTFLFNQLNVGNTKDLVEDTINPMPIHKDRPF